MKKKKIISLAICTAMCLTMVPQQVFAGESSHFTGYADGIYEGYGYGKTDDKMKTSIEVKNGKIVDVRLVHFADDGRKVADLKEEFFQSMKDYGPEFIARAIYELTEYTEFIQEKGASDYFAEAEKLMGKAAAEKLKGRVDSSGYSNGLVKDFVKNVYVKEKWKEVDSISGATFSAKGVANATAKAAEKSAAAYEANRTEIKVGSDYSPTETKSVPAKLYSEAIIKEDKKLGGFFLVSGMDLTMRMGSDSIHTEQALEAYLSKITNQEAVITIDGKAATYKTSGNNQQIDITIDETAFSQESIPSLINGPTWVNMEIAVEGYRTVKDQQILVYPASFSKDFFSYETLKGENYTKVDEQGNVSGYIEVKLPEDKPVMFNRQILADIGEDLDHHYIIMKSLPKGVSMKVSPEDISDDIKTLKIHLTGNNQEAMSKELNVRVGLNKRLFNGLFIDPIDDLSGSIFLHTSLGNSPSKNVLFFDAKNGLQVAASSVMVGFIAPEDNSFTLGSSKKDTDWNSGNNGKFKLKYLDGSEKNLSQVEPYTLELILDTKDEYGSYNDVDFDEIPEEGIKGKLIYDDSTYRFQINVTWFKRGE